MRRRENVIDDDGVAPDRPGAPSRLPKVAAFPLLAKPNPLPAAAAPHPRREDAERREAEAATADEEFSVVDWFQQPAREPGPARAFGTAPSPTGVEAVWSELAAAVLGIP